MKGNVSIYNFQFTIIFLLILLFPVTCALFPVLAHSTIQTVEMVEGGFEPQTANLDQNSTILFVNEDKVGRWPASNIHPTHSIYPEFDPKKPISPGESWLFKPKRLGEWKYHDHLLPHVRGTLIVRSEKGEVRGEQIDVGSENIFSKIFARIKEWFANFMDKFSAAITIPHRGTGAGLTSAEFTKLSPKDQFKNLENMVKTKGASDVWQYIKNTFKGQAGSSGNIHDLAHFTGGLIYEGLDFEGLSKCSPDFAFGCYHGFLDKAFEKNLDNLAKAETACGKLGPQNSGPVASCIHGIGHGVASFYNTNDIKSALLSCNNLRSGSNYCHDGVFMEFARGASSDFYPQSDRLSPCSTLKQEFGDTYSFACGRNQPEILMQRFKLSFEDVINVCMSSDDNDFKTACVDSLGFKLASTANSSDGIIAGCSKIPDMELMAKCATSGAGELIFQEVPGWQQKAPAVCNSLQMPYYASCHQHLQRLISEYKRI